MKHKLKFKFMLNKYFVLLLLNLGTGYTIHLPQATKYNNGYKKQLYNYKIKDLIKIISY